MKQNKKIPNDTPKSKDRNERKNNIARAGHKVRKEILQIRLADLRKRRKLTQSQVKGFSQVDVSRLESRKDMKVSTLVKYICGLGAHIEITASLSGGDGEKAHEITLFKAVGK